MTGFAVLLVSVQSEIWIECWKPCNNSNQTLLEKFVWRVQLIKLTSFCFINITIIEDNRSLIFPTLEILCNFYAGHVIIESFYDWATWLFRSGTVNDFLIRTGSRKYTIPQIYNRSHTKGELFLIHFACIFRNSKILHFSLNFQSVLTNQKTSARDQSEPATVTKVSFINYFSGDFDSLNCEKWQIYKLYYITVSNMLYYIIRINIL